MTTSYVVEFDLAEIAVLIIESVAEKQRPHGASPRDCLEQLERDGPGFTERFQVAAERVMEYVRDQFEKGQLPS